MIKSNFYIKTGTTFISLISLTAFIAVGSNYVYDTIEQHKIKKICKNLRHDSHKKRFMFIGDSFLVVGNSLLSDLFYNKINSAQSNSDVFNLGEAGIGPFDYYHKLLNVYKMAAKPDHVIIFLYLGNDILEVSNLSLQNSLYIDLRFIMKKYFPALTCIIRSFKNYITRARHIRSIKKHNMGELNLPKFLMKSPETYNRLFLIEDNESRKAINRTKKILLDMQKTARQNNSETLFVLIPPAFQIDKEYFVIFENKNNKLNNILTKTDKIQTELKIFFDENSIDYIDLLRTFRESQAKHKLYMLSDYNDHWTRDAILIIADILTEKYHDKIH